MKRIVQFPLALLMSDVDEIFDTGDGNLEGDHCSCTFRVTTVSVLSREYRASHQNLQAEGFRCDISHHLKIMHIDVHLHVLFYDLP